MKNIGFSAFAPHGFMGRGGHFRRQYVVIPCHLALIWALKPSINFGIGVGFPFFLLLTEVIT
jgi:hypothetical protein